MIFKVLTQQGKTYSDEIEFVIIKNEDGEIGILENHVPIIIQIKEGHLRFTHGKNESYLVVEQGIIEFKNNELTILALEAQMGATLEKARHAFDLMKKEKLELTKKENIDFSKQERDLKENITKSKAGQL
ncbi:ATP synthase F1 subunit epsilon [Peloplasma aerotolerans]|jgi:F-type H+-transporting ATPase subunit epsilon|uniref:ATP synthase epsilon chain n=1 Tax=Peloplasma aerotolerans TaxID=3044389 RepID=A0AAW6UBW9_9MOLU|nr:ATP synthase F1 subunit epsilon [Mariniplasma sp. M4Ah]MDI6453484.1 ATP synthase F1 subunit epsilon [Mariniplasma sp. M4Ah]MDR4969146.1 ATP synthase F1 subunit epsilon [Acholeplasmataceae bacterium]